ncbi:MAG: hypothetical protein U1E99_00905 [Agitococcus sp.]
MSRNLKIFLSTIFWVPFSFLLWLVFKGYAQSHLIQKIEMCAQTENSIPNMESEQADIAKFVTCLKEKTNPLVWWHLEPERLYQMAKPHTPCQWVGRWQAKRNNMSFAIDLDAYGKYQIDLDSLQNYQHKDQDENSFKGIWSSPSLTGVFKSLCQIFTLKKYSREIDT